MKIVALFLVILLNANYSNSQTISYPEQNGNNINNGLNKFVGTWLWVNDTDTIKIILKKENVLLPPDELNYRSDMIVGYHFYKKNGNIMENSLQYSGLNFADDKKTILGYSTTDDTILRCTFRDLTKNKTGKIQIEINSTQNQLTWLLSNTEGVRFGNFDPNFTLPWSGTLIRQPSYQYNNIANSY